MFPYFQKLELPHRETITSYNTMVDRKQIDYHLQKMAAINANVGKDSTDTERESAKKEINYHLAQIYKIDKNFFDNIRQDEIK